MKRILTFIAAAFCLCGCELFIRTIDAPTYMEMDGESYSSKVEEVPWNQYTMGSLFTEDQASFLFDYTRNLYSSSDNIGLYLCLLSEEAFEIGKRYPVTGMDSGYNQHYKTIIYKDRTEFIAQKGWVIFHDIEKSESYAAYLSGSFEFTAATEDGSRVLEVVEGTFDSIPVSFDWYENGGDVWYRKYFQP